MKDNMKKNVLIPWYHWVRRFFISTGQSQSINNNKRVLITKETQYNRKFEEIYLAGVLFKKDFFYSQ